MATLTHHPEGVDPRRLEGERARLGAVATLAPVDKCVANRNLAVIDVVLLAVVEFAGMRTRAPFPLRAVFWCAPDHPQ